MRFGLRESLFFLLLLAVPVAAFFLVFEPRNQDIEEAREEIRQKQAKLEALERATTTMQDLGGEIDRLTQAIALFERQLPAQRDVEVILREVAELAKKHDLMVESLRTDKVIPEAGYSKLPIRMQITGDFDSFYSFLLDLERLERITALPMLDLARNKQKRDEGPEMKADLRLDIFFEEPSRNDPRAQRTDRNPPDREATL